MALGILSAEGVRRAIAEYDALGRDPFLKKHGFGRATQYAVEVDGKQYDPKAIAGVAYGFDHPDQGTLPAVAFNGGRELEGAFSVAGFPVVKKADSATASLQALLERILNDYGESRLLPFSGTGNVQSAFRTLADQIRLSDAVATRPTVIVRPSFGQGNWASVPWVALLDNRETKSTQHGVYPVFLFREDMTGVYIAVAQGVTEPGAQGREALKQHLATTSDLVRQVLPDEVLDLDFHVDHGIDLKSKVALARNYELSTVIYKFYPKGGVPGDDSIVSDVEAALATVDNYITTKDHDFVVDSAVSLLEVAQLFREAVDGSFLKIATGPEDLVKALLAAVITKPFVIFSGLSGSGKTQLAMRLGEWLGSGPYGRRFQSVAVRPDWTGPEALVGYEDALRKPLEGRAAWYVPQTLDFLLRATKEPSMPYLLLLDEMNLAHVERYFSDYLSGLESREVVVPNIERGLDGEWRQVPDQATHLSIPRNLIVVGTVNVDETTYQFSPKVLDRAMTFEIRTLTSELDLLGQKPVPVPAGPESALKAFTEAATNDAWGGTGGSDFELIAAALRSLHAALAVTGDEFGQRVFYESIRLTSALERVGYPGAEVALDHIILLKILPRIHGSRRRAEPVLKTLLSFAQDPSAFTTKTSVEQLSDLTPRLPLSAQKIRRMLRAVGLNQFVSFID